MKKYLLIILLLTAVFLPTGCGAGQSQIVGEGSNIAYTGKDISFDFMKQVISSQAIISNLNGVEAEIRLGNKASVDTEDLLNLYKQLDEDDFIIVNSITRRNDYGYYVDCEPGTKGATWLELYVKGAEQSGYHFDTVNQVVSGIDPQKFYQTDENSVEIHFFTTPILTPPAISINKAIHDEQRLAANGGTVEWIAYFKKNMENQWILDSIAPTN